MNLNPREEKIIGTFSNNCTPFYKTPTTLLLRWADGEILAVFLEEMEDENDPDGALAAAKRERKEARRAKREARKAARGQKAQLKGATA